MRVWVVVGSGQESLGRRLCRGLGPAAEPTLWVLREKRLLQVDGQGAMARGASLQELAGEDGIAAYVVLHELPARAGFRDSGAHMLRRLWTYQAVRQEQAWLSPGVLIAMTDGTALASRDAQYGVLFGAPCQVVAAPFELDHLRGAVARAVTTRVRPSRIRPYLDPQSWTAAMAEADLQHQLGNLLGALTLLEGARHCGEVEPDDYMRIRPEIEGLIGAGLERLMEYFAARGVRWGLPGAGTATGEGTRPSPSLKSLLEQAAGRKGPGASLNILLVDNEADAGWASVLSAVLRPATVRAVLGLRADGETFSIPGPDRSAEWQPVDLSAYDLVILDVRLDPQGDTAVDRDIQMRGPGEAARLSGIRLLRKIRASPATSALPVLVLTASRKWYTAEMAREHRDVWFLSKEAYLPGLPPADATLESKAREHYLSFRRAVDQAVSWRRQNAQVVWKAIVDLERRRFERRLPKEFEQRLLLSLPTVRWHLRNAFEQMVQGVSRDDLDARPFYAAAVVQINMVAETLMKETETGRLIELLGMPRAQQQHLTYMACIEILRDPAAHAFAAGGISFHDALMAFGLAFKLTGVNWLPVGIAGHQEPERLVKDWAGKTARELLKAWGNRSVNVGKLNHGILRRSGGHWKNGKPRDYSNDPNKAPLAQAEARELTDVSLLFTVQHKAPNEIQLLFRYMVIACVLHSDLLPLDPVLAGLVKARWTHELVQAELRTFEQRHPDIRLGCSAIDGLPLILQMPLG